MSIFEPAPPPKSALGRHRILSPTASVRVSPLCLGAMNFGDAWKQFMGECNKKTSFEVLDYFYEQGGNFIDTANNYQSEESETWVGEWMAERGVRDEMVLATKYTFGFKGYDSSKQQSSFVGNSTKSLRNSVEASLKKLKTNYIDILYVHWWDFSTSIPEVMQSLNQLVLAGKVLYLAISDTPAWVVSKANEYARNHGMRQFCLYQGKWSAAERDFERDIIPMAREEGMGLAPWGALGSGYFKTEEQLKASDKAGRQLDMNNTPQKKAVSIVLDKLAKDKKTAITSIALAYVMAKVPYVVPVVGGRKIEHLKGNIEALSVELSEQDIVEIEKATPFDFGFPMNMLGDGNPADAFMLKSIGHFDYVDHQKPIAPHKE
ncbi:MAG: hypothetical protein M1824_003492 [Vezdaea acicularis]|nr:MAG: hypothetical protein M1824_003492 [Vezdaea acicularis]